MIVRQKHIDTITNLLTFLQATVKNKNSLNLTDVNIHAENFFRDFFNKLGHSFTNTNYDSQNAAFIDLIDLKNKKAIQITSQNDNSKISSTIIGFFSKKEYSDFELDVFLISKDAKNYRTDFSESGKYNFDHKRNVKDVANILTEINNKSTEELQKLADFLSKEVSFPRPKTESTEVETIMALIDFLSRDENRVLIDRKEDVDPDKKIYKRFAQHSDFLTTNFAELFCIYNSALAEARKGIDSVDARIIASYLQTESDQLLTKNQNDPKAALSELIEYFYHKLSENGFVRFDKQAIRFYLLDEIIRCNVFPNS